MLIKGIWSFVPETKHIITFFNPLNPIVGPNSTRKTTILEYLKLSCSNELPPNARSGHNFIHDPKVVVETKPNAQIKLRFRTSAIKDVVCIRSFQLTQKALKWSSKPSTSSFKPSYHRTGEGHLENVIFVHQDEANWPFQDPSTLKEKV
ncbi:hypothetical protein PRUPE_1G180400 [Prunus persica]|uniref:Rad50/SbcC-type AAA domain-containing protein n=1 Tax=Prunus persica TaxID=3760 RepID=M5Y4N8_PRUPE|nr:hypothetical protein PRUPE_1G180400 [Prunus persica]